MKSTERLFGKPREFFEPEISIFATRRIEAATELMKELAEVRRQGFPGMNQEQRDDVVLRYKQSEKAKKWWTTILTED